MLRSGGMFLGALGTTFATSKLAISYEDDEHGQTPPSLPWDFGHLFRYYDAASIRRGHQVYQQICATCHSMTDIKFRYMTDVCYTESEIKAIAAEFEYEGGPNEEGEMTERPGIANDYLPNPYTNENLARFANNGAIPPDLSCIIKARPGGSNYIFSLLTGYRDPPKGVEVREGMSYNTYFKGGLIAMPQQITDGAIDYDDGTPSTASQIAKDVTYFLHWASFHDHDYRIGVMTRISLISFLAYLLTVYYKRYRWVPLKARRLVVDTLN